MKVSCSEGPGTDPALSGSSPECAPQFAELQKWEREVLRPEIDKTRQDNLYRRYTRLITSTTAVAVPFPIVLPSNVFASLPSAVAVWADNTVTEEILDDIWDSAADLIKAEAAS